MKANLSTYVIETGLACSISLSLDVLDQGFLGQRISVFLNTFVTQGDVRDQISVLLELEFVVRTHLFVVVCKIYF